MPNPITNFKDDYGIDLGNKLITKEYLISVYPQIANQLITPELWVWGRNDLPALGDNTIINRSTPVTTFAGGANWKQVASSAESYSTVAIKTDGTLWTWGFNDNGQLGDNTTTRRSTPVTTFAGGNNWKQVSSGARETAAIKTDGTLWVWGNAPSLGINISAVFTNRLTPVTTFAGGNNWKQVSCGNQHMVAIKTDGTLWTWGNNGNGNLATNDTIDRLTPVTTFAGGTNWKQVVGGGEASLRHTAAIKTDGTLWLWGFNGILGLGTNDTTNRLTPVTTFAGGTDWKQVACGGRHTAAIKTDGTLWTWGRAIGGMLGNNANTNRSTPITTFAGGTNWKQVACGGYNTVAIKTDGTLWTWGGNSFGQLGVNTTSDRATPVTTFAGGTNWKQVAYGPRHIAAIKTSDDLQGI